MRGVTHRDTHRDTHRVMHRAMHRLFVLGCAWALSAGCVYYNGVYNAQSAAKQGNADAIREAKRRKLK
mgnify:CR=1 FL=1